MNLDEAIKNRHSVREYTDKKIEGNVKEDLLNIIDECNRESGLNIQLCLNEKDAFNNGLFAKFGMFKNVNNYIAIVGRKTKNLDELSGYYGQKIVLKATQLGLDSCWVALTYSKSNVNAEIKDKEKLVIVIAIGYGVTHGNPRKSKAISELTDFKGEMPSWFKEGLIAAQLAPTATNQQKFKLNLIDDDKVKISTSFGFYNKIDLGIVKYHFEIGAKEKDFSWI
ncbi:nitroreductase family protein [Methanobrevibacter sp. DSM 116169]|uniref:nitroreductase family protein n=1 Tax=Methanobrevibacter sp. DSM 116169 TaxID=3242727 RepID=UPI0038FD0582